MIFIIEILPVIVFFVSYKMTEIYTATLFMVFAALFSLISIYLIKKELSKVVIISNILLFVSATITLISGDPKYVKMKPTLLSITFSSILILGIIRKQGYIKYILGNSLDMEDSAWILLSKRFAAFFLLQAIINEIIWRNFSENFWVNFKLFGFTFMMILFLIMQSSLIMKHIKNKHVS